MPRAVLVVLVALVAAAACSDESDTTSPDGPVGTAMTSTATGPAGRPTTDPPSTSAADAAGPEGFERVRATVTEPDGTVCELCLWLADTAEQRRRGLMYVTDLGEAHGMAFRYPRPHTGTFWMKDTPLPLSIAFFDAAGSYLAEFDMEPCAADPCELHPTPSDFRVAIETTQGDLPELGIGPGSVLALTDVPCAEPG